MNRIIFAAAVATGAALLTSLAHAAQEFSISLNAGATYTDNVGRVSDNEQSETMAGAGLQMSLVNREDRLQTNIAADLQYRHFLDDSFDDELVGGLNGDLRYWFVPNRFAWIVQDNLAQALIDPRAVDTAANRQNINFFSTGPDFRLRLGARTDLAVQGRWSDASYEDSDVDNQRLTGSVSVIRHLAPTRSLSLNGTASRVEYDQSPPNSDYDTQSASLGFNAQGTRTTLDLQAGYTSLHDFGDSSDGPLFSLAVTRKVAARSTLSLNAGTNLIDTAEAFRRDSAIGGVSPDIGDAIVSRDPFQSDYLTIGLRVDGGRTGIRAAVDWRKEDHERDDALNRELRGASLELSRQLTPALTARLSGAWNMQDFDESSVDFDEWSVGAGIDWGFSRSFTVSLRGDHFTGSGDTSTGNGVRDYEENRIALRISYRPAR